VYVKIMVEEKGVSGVSGQPSGSTSNPSIMATTTSPMVVPRTPQPETTTSQTSTVTPSPAGTVPKVPLSSQYNRCTTDEWEYMTDVICGAETGNRPPMPKEITSFLQDKFQATDSFVRALENLEIQDMPTLINAMAAGP
jgi:hypothetical protein